MKIVPKLTIISVILLGLITSLVGCTQKTNSDVKVTSDNLDGKLLVKVIDKSTKKPINDAKIVIIGVDNTYKTDDKGLSPEITLKINKDFYKKYGDNLFNKAPSGSAAVMVSKEGYKDYVVFNKAVYPGYASNNLSIELPKLLKSDKQKYVADIDLPHNIWVEELVGHCKEIKEVKTGEGENKVTINVKDKSSKVIEGVSLVIPELGIKATTDKTGKVQLKVGNEMSVFDTYPVKKDYLEHTVVAVKEGYMPEVLLNAAIYKEKDNTVNIILEPQKDQNKSDYVVKCQAFDKTWVEKLISNYKQADTE